MTTGETPVATYPAHFESDVVLRNGRTLHLRPVRPEDRDSLLEFYQGMSRDSLYMRFFDTRTADAAVRDSPTVVDYASDFGVVGELGGQFVAIAHYFRSRHDPRVAEVAFAIADRVHGYGIGTHLLQKLAGIARTRGIEEFRAETLWDNQKMIDVFLRSGFDVTSRSADGSVHVSFPIAETELTQDRAAERSQKAAWASMKAIFEPRSIAVIGASRSRDRMGYEILRNLRVTGFRGRLFVVNRNAEEIDGVPSFPTMAAIPEAVDLAIVAVPAAMVESVIDDCVAKEVGAIVVVTAGFSEAGEEGRLIEQRLVDKVRAASIRMVGPNCMGVLNTDPHVNLRATFASTFPPHGRVGMSTQSGALGLAILDYARTLNVGFSTFISVGNKADVSGNDLIQYWAEDPNTDVMLLYLESFGNPRKFGEIARRVGRRKPIVAVKSGRSSGASSQPPAGAGTLTRDAIVSDLFRQAGIIRTETLEELFDVAAVLANQLPPPGTRVGIVTNAGGAGVLAADTCEANGLELAQLTDETRTGLQPLVSTAANGRNPVKIAASADAADYRRAIELMIEDPNVDAINIIYIPVVPGAAENVATAIRECAAEARGKTLVATFMSAQGTPSVLHPVPSFPFPERAITALARATRYAEWRRRPVGTVVKFDDFNKEQLRAIVDRKIETGGGWLDNRDAEYLLRAAGIGFAEIDIRRGVDVMVGAFVEPTFGHVVTFGAGGPLLELLPDVATRIQPLTDVDADDMLREARASRLLQAAGGEKVVDVASLKEVILRVSQLLEVCPEVRELSINPLKVLERGSVAAAAHIRIEAVEPEPPSRRISY